MEHKCSDMEELRSRKKSRVRSDNSGVNMFDDVPLTDAERRFLICADSGNLKGMAACLQENERLNVNCVDFLGRTALQLAVHGDYADVVQFLLGQCRLDVVEDAFLHAIKNGSIKQIDLFLSSPIYASDKANARRRQLEVQQSIYDHDESNSDFEPDITPIILAAHYNNFDVIFLLQQKGHSIATPHQYFCTCFECTNHKTYDRVVHSRSRLNQYRGLASTAYMALASEDPVIRAFSLSVQLSHLASKEREYKAEYDELANNCKNFAVDLLDICRTEREVRAVLQGSVEHRDLSRIRLAIKYDQKRFIAHAHTQEYLMDIWYSDVPWLGHNQTLTKVVMVPLIALGFPILSLIYYAAPHSKIGAHLRSPFIKFAMHSMSYFTFLVFLVLATNQQKFDQPIYMPVANGIINGVIMVYVLGMFWNEIKQFYEEGPYDYLTDIWNLMDMCMISLYSASFAIDVAITLAHPVIYTVPHDIPVEPAIVANSLFAIANVLSFTRIAYLLPASEIFGQLQISYGRMLQDVTKFIFIYATMILAFVCGVTSLYNIIPYASNSILSGDFTDTWQGNFLSLFWAIFGMGSRTAPLIPESLRHVDYMLIIEVVGHVLYGCYLMFAVVVLINMLIAMMSSTFEKVRNEEDMEWKFARAKLWLSYFDDGCTLPIPFNLLPTPKSIAKVFKFLKSLTCNESESNTSGDDLNTNNYLKIIRKVVMRYVHLTKSGKKKGSTKDDFVEMKEDLSLSIAHVHTRIDRKLGDLINGMMFIEETLSDVEQNIHHKDTTDEAADEETRVANAEKYDRFRKLMQQREEEKEQANRDDDDSLLDAEWNRNSIRKKKRRFFPFIGRRHEIDNVPFVYNPNNPDKLSPPQLVDLDHLELDV